MFLIVLSDQGYNSVYGSGSQAPYLSTTLRGQGELITNYFAVAGSGLANAVALISGQGPNAQTVLNCPTYSDHAGAPFGDQGQVKGSGCVYPSTTLTLGDQLVANGGSWKAYVEDIGKGAAAGAPTTCRHPALGAADADLAPRPGDASVTWRDPFVYFHSVIDADACVANVVGLDRLAPDLADAKTAPSLAYIVPNRCHDGNAKPCAEGQPAGLPAADDFLKTLIPQIMGSPAYKDAGLIAITFDEAPQTGPNADPSGCCDAPAYPNLPSPASPASTDADSGTASTDADSGTASTDSDHPSTPSATPPPTSTTILGGTVVPTGGGGQVGLLLVSPFIKPGSQNLTSYYNHFSLLASIEDLFSLTRLGYAAAPTLTTFDRTIYTAFSQK